MVSVVGSLCLVLVRSKGLRFEALRPSLGIPHSLHADGVHVDGLWGRGVGSALLLSYCGESNQQYCDGLLAFLVW